MSAANPDDVEAVFAKGTLQFFDALANMQEGYFNHNIAVSNNANTLRDLRALIPIPSFPNTSRLLPVNPDGKPMTYRALRNILTRFVDDLKAAEATLARVGDRATKLPLQPFKIAIDFNHDNQITSGESLLGVMLGMGRRGRNFSRMTRMAQIIVAFDTADASWLRGYSNLLMATTNLLLAFDFEKSYETIAHNYYGSAATKFGMELERGRPTARDPKIIQTELDAVINKIKSLIDPTNSRKKLSALNKQLRALPRTKENAEERKLLIEARRALNAKRAVFYNKRNKVRREKRRLTDELAGRLPRDRYGEIFDIVAYIHTLNWTVIEPERLKSVRSHFLKVATINHTTWRLIRAETDNDREWLPNPSQNNPFGARRLTDKIIDSLAPTP